MTLAILCSGQGAQHPDMFALTGSSQEAAPLFEYAESWLGEDPRTWVRGANSQRLRENRNAQLLCVLQALAGFATLRSEVPDSCCLAGYSIGELAAWGLSGILSSKETLSLSVARADAMNSACRELQGMVSVRGLSEAQITTVIGELRAEIAIANPDSAYVVGGVRSAIEAVAERAKKSGARRIMPLSVEVASHTSLLERAARDFRTRLRQASLAPIRSSKTRLLSGIDGSQVVDVEAGLDKLSFQIAHRLEWSACLETCIEAGATAFLELGPGRALSEMVRASYPDAKARSLEDFQTLDGARSWMRAALDDHPSL